MSNRDGDVTFEDLMSQMGVRRMGNRPTRSKKKSKRTAAKPQKSVQKKPPAPPPPPNQRTQQQRDAARQALQPAPQPRTQRPTASQLASQVEELQQQLSAAKTNLNAEREARQRLSLRLQQLESERDGAIGRAEGLQLELESQELQLNRIKRRLTNAEEPGSPRLEDVLEQRGIKGADEATFLIRGLLETRQLGDLLVRLQTDDPAALLHWLEDRVVLLCDAHHEMAPGGRSPLKVPKKRCEVCGGSDIKWAVRLFLDACLLNGMTRVSIVGGTPKHHRMLRGIVQHKGLHLQLAPTLSNRTPSQVRSDLENSDVVILWMRGEPAELAAQYQNGPTRVIVTEQGSLATLLVEVAERINR
ncbi:MAG: hypothetical protein AAFV53_39540 [Myxococcota bacterium]